MPLDDENPKWSSEMLAKAKRGRDALPAEVLEAFGSKKTPISIRLDPDVLDYFKRSGAGWQSRINAALRAAMEAGG